MSEFDNNFFRPERASGANTSAGLQGFSSEPTDTLSGASVSKRREFRRKRNRIRRIILISLSIIIGILLALVATDFIKIGTGPRPSFENSSSLKKNLPTTQV